jgi:hypothetical protein
MGGNLVSTWSLRGHGDQPEGGGEPYVSLMFKTLQLIAPYTKLCDKNSFITNNTVESLLR